MDTASNFSLKSADRGGAYRTGGVTFNNYAAGWNDFLNSLQSGDAARFNLTLRFADYYGNGNLLSAEA